jgi:hypothetical protein
MTLTLVVLCAVVLYKGGWEEMAVQGIAGRQF